MLAYLLVSFCAFWMSVSTPCSVNAFSSWGRSPFSQRLDDSASGRMMQARLAGPELPPVASPPGVAWSRLQATSVVIARPTEITAATVALLVRTAIPSPLFHNEQPSGHFRKAFERLSTAPKFGTSAGECQGSPSRSPATDTGSL